MANALRKTRIVAFILALIEIGLFATGIALYLYDIPSGIQAAIKPQFWAFGAGVVAFANIVAVAIIIAHISRIRQKSDLRAADVIGGDVQEAVIGRGLLSCGGLGGGLGEGDAEPDACGA